MHTELMIDFPNVESHKHHRPRSLNAVNRYRTTEFLIVASYQAYLLQYSRPLLRTLSPPWPF